MSDTPLSAEEKKRILRERRQAKMAKGQASDRLNTILGLGSSVKDNTAVSVLDKAPKTPQASPSPTPQPNHHVDPDADPEIQHIDTIAQPVEEPDIDQIFKSILSHGDQHEANGEDPISQMMKNMFGANAGGQPGAQPEGSPFGIPQENPEETQYQKDLVAYNQYEQRLWKFRFLVIRYIAVFWNFFYHFYSSDNYAFQASSYDYIRGLGSATPVKSFFTWFSTIETVLLATFYMLSSNKNLFATASENSLLIKGLSFGSMVLPQLSHYKPLVVRFLAYYEIFGMFLADISLVVVLFGLLS
ncbi:GET complex, subunit GET2, partial [Suhomyces tanzawaensis NRRL Y-17324]